VSREEIEAFVCLTHLNEKNAGAALLRGRGPGADGGAGVPGRAGGGGRVAAEEPVRDGRGQLQVSDLCGLGPAHAMLRF